ncbi:MAG: 4Fe-4S binding protein [Candidatus Omnitrophota bacterium]
MKRKVIKIDEEKCNGCGECIPDCPEGALKIVDGKVKLMSESLCDGLGACVGRCPVGALTIEERDAEEFDEEKAQDNMEKMHSDPSHQTSQAHQGCPGMMARQWQDNKSQATATVQGGSALRQWPIQLKLLNPHAPYFQDAELVIAADCVPFSFANFHERFLKGKILIIFCPKLDFAHEEYVQKLTEIIKSNNIKSLTTVHMEVPCCNGTTVLAEEALKSSGKNLILKDYTISLQGEII